MLKVFYMDVVYVAVAIHICCKHVFVNVSSVCSKCFLLQVLHDQAWEVDADGGGPLGHSGPRVCARKQSGRGSPHMHG